MSKSSKDDLSYIHRHLTPLINRELVIPELQNNSAAKGKAIAMPSHTAPDALATELQSLTTTEGMENTTILQPIAFRYKGNELVNYNDHPEISAHAALLVFENTTPPRITYIDSEGFELPLAFKAKLSKQFPDVEIQEVRLKQQQENTADCCPILMLNAKAVVNAVRDGREINAGIFTRPTPGEITAQRVEDAPFLEQINQEEQAFLTKLQKDANKPVPVPGYKPQKTLMEHFSSNKTLEEQYRAKEFVADSAKLYKEYVGHEPDNVCEKLLSLFMNGALGIFTEIQYKAIGISAPGHDNNYHNSTLMAGNTDWWARFNAAGLSQKPVTPSLLTDLYGYSGLKTVDQLLEDPKPESTAPKTPSKKTSKAFSAELKKEALAIAKSWPSAPPSEHPTPSAPPSRTSSTARGS